MALSDTAVRVLTEAGQHPLRLATPPKHLPAAACNAVLRSLLKGGYVEECPAPSEYIGLGWRQQDGAWIALRVTDAGLLAIGTSPTAALTAGLPTDPTDTALVPDSAPLAPPTAPEVPMTPTGAEDAQAPAARPSLRDAAHRVLSAWDDEASQRADLPGSIATLRAILVKPTPAARTAAARKPREGTKQQQVLALLRRSEGATVAQIAEATGWQAHTVRGLFAGLKKRQGIAVEAAERVRQVGPGKEGAKGSYTVYRIAEAS